MCWCTPNMRTPCCGSNRCHAMQGVVAIDCPFCNRPKGVPKTEHLAASRRLLEQLEQRIAEVGYDQTVAEVEEILARRQGNVA